MESGRDSAEPRARFLAGIERFIGMLLDRLEESPRGKMLDEKENRMWGSVVMKSYGIWMRALLIQTGDPTVLVEKFRRLSKRVSETVAKEEKD